MLQFSVNKDRCNRCGLCASDCPPRIIELNANRQPFVAAENEANCMECQHCLAVCPTAAISVFGLNPDDSLPTSADVWPSFDVMTHLMRGRRSVRHYRDQDVEPELIVQLLNTVANAPTGVNYRSLTFTLIDDKNKLHRLREKVMAALTEAQKAGRIPPRLSYIEHAISGYAEHGVDVIFRGAPHALIVSTPPQSPCATEDVPIALSYFELLAQSAGLGTVWCGLLKLAFESVPSLKALVDLPQGHHYYAMLFGYPAIHFARTVQRDNAATIKRPKIGGAL
jgi:nitroreductase/NAD-dependent dihydropyrimidine dehydrogenase PreA subunit